MELTLDNGTIIRFPSSLDMTVTEEDGNPVVTFKILEKDETCDESYTITTE